MDAKTFCETVESLNDDERAVYDSIVKQARNGEYCGDAKETVHDTGFPLNKVKGLLGSLTKKDLVWTDREERGNKMWSDIFAYDMQDDQLGHWCFGEFNPL